MAYQISPEDMERYRAGARERQRQREERHAQRRARASEVAHAGARLLKEEFRVQRVVLFGSLARTGPFDEHSDVDLAVWGLDARDYFRALGRLLSLDAEIPVDLIEIEQAPERLRAAILIEGIEM